ncbi:MAG: amidohydrolase [Rhodospirillaceae bacterium]|nr:amidohydrolase [Rhodospirillaceae bacterium]
MRASKPSSCIFLAVAALFVATPVCAETTVLRNFTLIDGTGRAAVAASAMVVDDGKISWIGPMTQLKAPAGAAAVDLSGKFVMPGIINLHGHIGNVNGLTQDKKFFTRENVEKDLRNLASYGVTTVQTLGTDADIIFPIRAAQRAGRPTMTRVYTSGQGIVFKGGYGGVPGLNEPVATAAEAAKAVETQVAKGVDFVKIWVDDELKTMPTMPAEISQAVIDTAHRHKIRALAHVFYLADAKRLTDQGIDGFVHSVRDQPVDQALIDSMKKRGTWMVSPTLSREIALFVYGTPAPQLTDPFFIRGVTPEVLALLASPERQKSIADGPNYRPFQDFFRTAMGNSKRLIDAGVNMGFGTDSGPPGRFGGYHEHWELALMVEAGMTPAQAIRSATGTAASYLNAKDLGTLETGKWADLIVLNADPLADIKNTRTINAVYIAGNAIPAVKP